MENNKDISFDGTIYYGKDKNGGCVQVGDINTGIAPTQMMQLQLVSTCPNQCCQFITDFKVRDELELEELCPTAEPYICKRCNSLLVNTIRHKPQF